MKNYLCIAAVALVMTSSVARAQDARGIGGARAGVEASWTIGSIPRDALGVAAAERKSRSGAGYRGFVGYDLPLGSAVVIGVEAGIGGGGRTVTQAGAGGQYSVDPRLTYDISGRIGFAPTDGLLLYARGGYRWLQSDRSRLANTVGAARVTTRQTDGGLTYGIGAEIGVAPSVSLRADLGRTRYDRNFRQDRVAVGALFGF